MFKKIAAFMVGALLGLSIYGCLALVAGGAAGGGTAIWLSEKLTQEVNAPFDRTVKAVKSALASLNLTVTKETVEPAIAQIMSKYSDGRTIWIDVHRITDSSSKVEVRVGVVSSDKQAAEKILKEIKRYL